MADNTKNFIVQVTATGVNEAARGLDNVASAGDRVAQSSRELDAAAAKTHRTLQGTANTTSNTTKAFAKMAQSMSGVIVPVYATVAANAFALTSAFRALSTAMDTKVMLSAADQYGNRMGTNLVYVSSKIKEVTQNAIAMEEAMGHAALASAAGFSTTTIEALTKAATSASMALGRDLSDSMQRVFKGVVKAEPELLDELGIILRLETAAAKYAAQVGKAASELTTFEKQQAVANEVIRQATDSFGDLNEQIAVNPYSQLGAALTESSKSILNSINETIIPAVSFFAENQAALNAAILAMVGYIGKLAVPGLRNYALAAKEASLSTAAIASSLQGSMAAQDRIIREELQDFGRSGLKVVHDKIVKTGGTLPKAFAEAYAAGIQDPANVSKIQRSMEAALNFSRGSNTLKFGGTTFYREFFQDVVDNIKSLKAGVGTGLSLSEILFSRSATMDDKKDLLRAYLDKARVSVQKFSADTKLAFSDAMSSATFSEWARGWKSLGKILLDHSSP